MELGAYDMDERKTAENLAYRLRTVCNEWGLVDDHISSIVSDSGANIKAAIKAEFGERKHISCFGHTLNNIGQIVIENNCTAAASETAQILDFSDEESILNDTAEIVDLSEATPLRQHLRKVKYIVRFFKSSEVATSELKALQNNECNGKNLKLIQEVRTRWNSCYEMVDRFLQLSDFVGRVLLQVRKDKSSRAKPPDMLTGNELDILSEVRDLLKPLYNITTEISSEKNVTLSKCIPMIVGLRLVCTITS